MDNVDYRGFEIKIQQDEMAEDPRDWEHLGKMVYWHNRYTLGDKHDFADHEEFEKWAKKEKVIYLPIYMYDHSGITISTAPFSCGWDSGQIGYIYIERKDYRKAWNKKRVNIKHIQLILKSEVQEYDDFISGNVYGYSCEPNDRNKKITCDDSCWGFYGYNFEKNGLLVEAKENINYSIKEYKQKVIKEKAKRVQHREFMKVCF